VIGKAPFFPKDKREAGTADGIRTTGDAEETWQAAVGLSVRGQQGDEDEEQNREDIAHSKGYKPGVHGWVLAFMQMASVHHTAKKQRRNVPALLSSCFRLWR
jgi:hypothetical protein